MRKFERKGRDMSGGEEFQDFVLTQRENGGMGISRDLMVLNPLTPLRYGQGDSMLQIRFCLALIQGCGIVFRC
jgi:hypothetical protein